MAKKEYKTSRDLPIYKKTKELVKETAIAMNHFTRDYKHTLGQQIFNEALMQLSRLDDADANFEKRDILLKEFINHQHSIEELIKLGVELGALDERYYIAVIPLLTNIEKQAFGWYGVTTTGQSSETPSEECIQ